MTDERAVEILWLEHYLGNPPTAQNGVLVVEGYQLPDIKVTRSLDMAHDGMVSVTLDQRFTIDTTDEQIYTWGWLLANAMAWGAGFTAFGPNQRRRDSFIGAKVHIITSASDEVNDDN